MKHTIKTFFTLALALALFGMTACKGPSDNNSDSTDESVRPWTAELTLSSDKLGIKVTVTTDDGTPVTVEGCTETELKSGTETDLNANGTTVKLTGKITALSCSNNKLTGLNVRGGLTALRSLSCDKNELASLDVQGCTVLYNLSCDSNKLPSLNVQGCTALKELRCEENQLAELNVQGCTALRWLGCYGNKLDTLNVEGFTALSMLTCAKNQLTSLNIQGCTVLGYLDCYGNKLDAAALTKILNDLPVYEGGLCTLYTEQTDVTEDNSKDFTSATAPADLKAAFTKAKTEKKWTMKKYNASGNSVEI